jgi:HEAT repeat protein
MRTMKRTIVIAILVAAVAALRPSAWSGPEKGTGLAGRVAAVLARFPAPDPATKEALCAELVRLGPAAVSDICGRLLPPGAGDDSAAEYALNGLAVHVKRSGAENERRMFAAALAKALGAARDKEVKAFLMAQLQLAGGDESVKTLAGYLSDERLAEPAAQALVAIKAVGTDRFILGALDRAPVRAKATLLRALGELHSRLAVKDLLAFAGQDDEAIRQAALFALAEIGDPAGEPALARVRVAASLEERSSAPTLYLRFARRLVESGQRTQGLRIARSLLMTHTAGGESVVAGEALALIVQVVGAAALPDLLAAADSPDTAFRGHALRLAATLPGPNVTAAWVEKARSAGPDFQVAAIAMLEARGDKAAIPFLLESLRSADASVRLAAIPAAVTLAGKDAVPAILPFFGSDDEAEVAAAKDALLLYPAAIAVPEAHKILATVPIAGRAALVEVLGEKGTADELPRLFAFAGSPDLAVRIAAARALGKLASAADLPQLVGLLFAAADAEEDVELQNAIVAVATRNAGPEKRADGVLEILMRKSGPARAKALRLLPRLGGENALRAAVADTANPDPEVQAAAVYALSQWPEAAAMDALLAIIKTTDNRKYLLLAIEGSARLAVGVPGPREKRLALLRGILALVKDDADKRAVLRALPRVRLMESFLLAGQFLSSEALREEAVQALFEFASRQSAEERWLSAHQAISLLRRAAGFLADEEERELASRTIDDRLRQGGFIKLFDGRSFAGWKGLVADPPRRAKMTAEELRQAQAEADASMRAHWRVEDGVLIFDGAGESLCTAKDYGDFELLVDWKIGPHGDSGIYLRGSPQVQIWDPADHPEGSGGLYNNQKGPSKPAAAADNPVGSWNTFRIIMLGERVTVYLNDTTAADNVVLENYWERDKPIYASGPLELQAHGNPLWFRSIYLREIPREAAGTSASALSAQEVKDGFVPLFNGGDLAGWTGDTKGYAAVDGKIVIDPERGGGNLYTEREFGDFILRFEFKLPPAANNGVGVRAPLEGDAAYQGLEIQILEDSSPVWWGLNAYQYHGSVYGIVPARRGALKAPGEWNSEEIAVRGRKVAVTVNGTTVVETDLDEASAGGTVDGREHPGLARTKGHLGFLGHGSRVEFRNIRVKDLGGSS